MASSLLLGLKFKQTDTDVSFRQTLGDYIDSHYGTAAGERVTAVGIAPPTPPARPGHSLARFVRSPGHR